MAVWNDYLTELDKQHLAISSKQGQYGLGERPVILVIDVYYRALGHERKPLLESIKDWPRSCGLDGWVAVDRMIGLLDAARVQNVPVVYTRGISGFSKINIKAGERSKSGNRGGDRLPGLANEIVAEVAPRGGDRSSLEFFPEPSKEMQYGCRGCHCQECRKSQIRRSPV